MHRGQAGDKDAQVPQDGAGGARKAGIDRSQTAEIDGEVEVRAGEGLDDGEADEEVAGGDPVLGDDVLAEERDDDGAAAEDDGAGEVEVREEAVEQGRGGEGAAQDHDYDKGDEEADYYCRACLPADSDAA